MFKMDEYIKSIKIENETSPTIGETVTSEMRMQRPFSWDATLSQPEDPFFAVASNTIDTNS
jgi:hypothetical protein